MELFPNLRLRLRLSFFLDLTMQNPKPGPEFREQLAAPAQAFYDAQKVKYFY